MIAPILPAGPRTYGGEQQRLALTAAGLGICALPVLLPNAPGNITPADAAILVGVLAVLMWAGTTRQRTALPYGLGVGLLAIAGLVASLVGAHPAIGLVSVGQDLYLLVWCAAVANVARGPGAVQVLARTWTVSATAWAAAFVIATTGTAVSAGPQAIRAGFTFGDQNGAGLYFILSLFVVIASGRPRRRWLRSAVVALLLLATLYTGSLGAFSGLLLGLSIAMVLTVRSRRGALPAIALALSMVLAAASLTLLAERDNLVSAANASSNALVRNSIGRGDQSSSERQTLSAETLHLWQSSDLLGLGPASTKDVLQAQQAPYPKEAHDDWVAALIERGLLGALGLLLLFAEIVMRASRSWDPARLLVGMRTALPSPAYLVGGLGCVLVFSTTHEVLHDRTSWTLFALVAAVSLWGRPEQQPQGGSA
jgi:O-antigen ligase